MVSFIVTSLRDFRRNLICSRPYKKMLGPLLLSLFLAGSPLAASDGPRLPAFPKGIPHGFGKALDPNVLLLIDTSGSMAFSLSGNCTWGDGGARVYLNNWWNYMAGRDLVDSNNDPDVPYNYHPKLKVMPKAEADAIKAAIGNAMNDFYYHDKGVYYYPNDSRMYALKLVLWEILNDRSFVGDLNLALATYAQDERVAKADWYRFRPEEYRPKQYISSKGGDLESLRHAALRVSFGKGDDRVAKIAQWVDGHEGTGDPELRADGATPLGDSLYLSGESQSAAGYYTRTKGGPVQGWCQDNYVIVLTDGDDDTPEGVDLKVRVKSLYDSTTALTFFSKPGRPVQTFVVGLATGTLRETLNAMADVGWDGKEDGEGPRDGPDQAFFADDVASLLDSFRQIFGLIQAKRGAGGAPLVSPPVGGSGGVYLASFVPSTERVWTGKLTKKQMNDDGTLNSGILWEVGEMAGVAADNRKICTADWSGLQASKFAGSNLALFKADQAARLADEMLVSADAANLPDFIDWVRGKRMPQDSDSGERWKLGDMFHTGLVEVGPPSANEAHTAYKAFAEAHKERERSVYVQANDGMLHAFDAGSGDKGGEELWAFIPPNVLSSQRLTAQVLDGEGEVLSLRGIPHYLLDGPVVAEDLPIGTDGAYRTVLIGLGGYGGTGFYLLDVTDRKKPQFLWAVENDIYEWKGPGIDLKKEADRRVLLWKARQGTGVPTAELTSGDFADYSYLRRTMATPFLGRARIGNEVLPLVFVGAGAPCHDEDQSGGRAALVIDARTAEIVGTLTHDKMGTVQAPITALGGSEGSRVVRTIYFGDGKGQIFESDLSVLPSVKRILSREGEVAASLGIPYAIEAGRHGKDIWLFAGMGDPAVVFEGAKTTKKGYLVAINRTRAGEDVKLEDLAEISADEPLSTAGPTVNVKGWYMPLASGGGANEVVTTPPLLYRESLFFATFLSSEDPCTVGKSRFYVLDALTGRGLWGGGKKYVELPGWVISGVSVVGDRVLLSGTDHSQGGYELPSEMSEYTADGNLIAGPVPEDVPEGGGGVTPGVIRPVYWREWSR